LASVKTLVLPVSLPFALEKLSADGRVGLIEKLMLPYPPLADTGATLAVSIDCIKVTVEISSVVIREGRSFTNILIPADVVADCVSVAVTRYSTLVLVTDGVPEMNPVAVLNVNPLGNAGVML
jgi:hypothetical protein